MEPSREDAGRLKSLAKVLGKEYLAGESGESWFEVIGKIAVIITSFAVLSLMAVFAILYVMTGGRHRVGGVRRDDMLSSMTGSQFLLIWGAVMVVTFVLGWLAYRRHKASGKMVDEWSETKGKNPFEPFTVMIFQTLDSFFGGKSAPEAERAGLFAAHVLTCAADAGGLALVTSFQISPGTTDLLRRSLKDLPPPLEQEEIMKALFKSGVLTRKASLTTTSEAVVPGEAGTKLLRRFGLLPAR